ncbi:aminotransferase class III-fold pyridoxal phosphate-dependent enzyme [Verminephrobacter eiseniae]|uniref:aminotransferase class III-fold pyridoxal phosphate-dependent enzyme n=2 Tax=Verminephrobacter eiseniae TaxID=364317 RepID=UPI002238CD18|nr:aminotransferase class III-fold pyridoxal phosphate-dependent enzyme [Verminephrobacter eiseniae]MCW5231594.1 aminotransferase class III-fold pyridoxal phosphate-dependent enzyme [Verminephrobacter eiseniae]MCW5293323.1 aminotransferase class III-fold pyridoxal phosphate-dependent enzyme [Verminephrobacter eiseniae]MCW8187621.1 aminotransferase class III-fold pyridoxal phosphate-dependent enzyme [Verminephrobacter eiseniae]MCW8225932.1 aminotransferase class III-fold pyridoxal phosphate-depe
MTIEHIFAEPSRFERFVNPEIGELIRRIGLDKTYVHGQGCVLRDEHGHEYLDFLASYGALPFGHAPKSIMDALVKLVESCEPIFVQPSSMAASGELAERLIALAPGEFRTVTFQNSGAETVEAAFKACIAATGRRRILAARNSFHGKTMAALSATGNPKYQHVFHAPIAGFDFVDFGDAAAVRNAFHSGPSDYAAIILEPVQGEGGIHVAPDGYFREVRQACDEYGVMLIVDEVQTGLGRTGRLFAIERDGIQADCLLLAKALGGGVVPIGACLLAASVQTEEFHLKHSSTFGGNTLACRVGLASLNRLTAPGSMLLANVKANGDFLLSELHRLAHRYGNVISEVRGVGYLIGVEFDVNRTNFERHFGSFMGIAGEQDSLVPLLASHMLNVGRVRVAPTLNGASTLRIEPPLIATRAHCEQFLAAFEQAVALVSVGNTGALLAHLTGGLAVERSSADGAPRNDAINPSVPRFGFLVHPLEPKNYAEFDESLAGYDEAALALMEDRLNPVMDPFYVSTVRLTSPTGARAEGDFITVPRSAAQLAAMPLEESTALIEEAMGIARKRGASLIGLGGHTSIVTSGGTRVAGKGIAVSTGNTYTMLSAVEAACSVLAKTGRSISDVRVAVIGGTGSIGSAIARVIAAQARWLTLIGNPRSAKFNRARFGAVYDRIADYAQSAVARTPGSILDVVAGRLADGQSRPALVQALLAEGEADVDAPLRHSSALAEELQRSDFVLVATSSTDRFISPEHLKAGAIVCDLSRPANVSHEIARSRHDVLVIDGGIVEVPGRALLGSRFGIPEDLSYACMAEVMMMALGGVNRDASLGLDLASEDLELFQRLSVEHGFRLAGLRSFDKALEPEHWARYIAQFSNQSAAVEQEIA